LSEACIDHLKTIPRCTTPKPLKPPLSNDKGCDVYIATKINYTECVANHKDDKDFYRGEWRFYLGRDTLLWKSKNEIVELRDEAGKLFYSRKF
jgi:hypothetical protein